MGQITLNWILVIVYFGQPTKDIDFMNNMIHNIYFSHNHSISYIMAQIFERK